MSGVDIDKIGQFIVHCVFPKRCAACRTVIEYDKIFCSKCGDDLPELTGRLCRRCFNRPDMCRCRDNPPEYQQVCAPFDYSGAVREALLELKRYRNGSLCDMLGEYMAVEAQTDFEKAAFDCVMPVPMEKKKLRQRGYNQSELLAKSVAKNMNLPLVCDVLRQKTHSKTQHTLGYEERHTNVQNVYFAKPCKFHSVLLVDDIITTGATMSACAAALKNAGAVEVFGVSAAKSSVIGRLSEGINKQATPDF